MVIYFPFNYKRFCFIDFADIVWISKSMRLVTGAESVNPEFPHGCTAGGLFSYLEDSGTFIASFVNYGP